MKMTTTTLIGIGVASAIVYYLVTREKPEPPTPAPIPPPTPPLRPREVVEVPFSVLPTIPNEPRPSGSRRGTT